MALRQFWKRELKGLFLKISLDYLNNWRCETKKKRF